MNILELFFLPTQFFIAHPERIAALATMFFVAFLILTLVKNYRCWPLLINTGLWTAFALWEWSILAFSNDANIRVDLLIIYPILLASTIWSIFTAIKNN